MPHGYPMDSDIIKLVLPVYPKFITTNSAK